MREYRWLLMDADNTLFDFNAAEEFALTRTLLHYGISPTEEAKAGYHAINNALWAASDQGKITQQALMNERFVRFFEARGIQGNSAEWNQFFLEQLSQCSVLLPGAEALCRKLSQKYILALCTNSAAPFVARRRLEVDCPPDLLERAPVEKRAALLGVLAEDPRPAYQGDPDRVYGMAFAGLEVRFTVAGERLTVLSLDRQNPSS